MAKSSKQMRVKDPAEKFTFSRSSGMNFVLLEESDFGLAYGTQSAGVFDVFTRDY